MRTKYIFKKEPTDLWGLKYSPVLENYDMDRDLPKRGFPGKALRNPYIGIQKCDKHVIRDEIAKLGDKLKFVLEIGVSNLKKRGSTWAILEAKPKEAAYLGVDLHGNFSWVHQYENSEYINCESDSEDVETLIKESGSIDLYFIDGWHSVNQVMKEWKWVKYLSEHGVIIFHDISQHPGPMLIFDAIDEELFEKEKYEHIGTLGLGVVRRK